MEVFILIVSCVLLLFLAIAGVFIYMEICKKSPCKMIRACGKCPFGEFGDCSDCIFMDEENKA